MGLPLSTSLDVSVSFYAIIPAFIYLAVRWRLDAKHERNLRLTCLVLAAISFAVNAGIMSLALLHLVPSPAAVFFWV
jgi:peptidoglycan/LPS O-acetylase OafA/YrhL